MNQADKGERIDKWLRKRREVAYAGLFFVTGIVVAVASLLYGFRGDVLIRNVVTAFICAGVVIFLTAEAVQGKTLLYDNREHPFRFALVYLAGLLMSVSFPAISSEAWPYIFVFVALALFSNGRIGLITGTEFLALSVLLSSDANTNIFLMYLFTGVVGITLLNGLTEQTNIGPSVFIIISLQAVLMMAFDILQKNRSLSVVMFVVPGVNIVLSLILLLLFLNLFGVYVIRGSNDRYMDVNDTQFPLLVQMKDKNKDEYYRSIHTAYLAERIALDLGLNARAVKTMAYYHRIGVVNGAETWEEIQALLEKHDFPEEAIGYLKEYIESRKGERRTKEYTVINMSETLIASIMYLFAKDNKAQINVDALIDRIFANKMEERAFHNSDISLYEIDRMKAIMKKERLYYDFLR